MPAGPIEVNGIAAKVGSTVITKNKVAMSLAPSYAQLVAEFPRRGPQFEAKFKVVRDEIIQELVDREIILQEFKTIGASIKPHVVDDDIKRQMQVKYNGDEARFREDLKQYRLTMEGYREMTREKLVVQAMRAKQFSDAPPPLPGEVQKEYDSMKRDMRDRSKDKVTFQKIFIPAMDQDNPVATPDSQLVLAEDIAKQLSEGADFGELAKKYSKDAFAESGGLQEDVPRLDLSPEFASILIDAPVGKIVGPLLDRQGFTIAKASKIDYGPTPPLTGTVRDHVEKIVSEKKTSAQYKKWIDAKRKRAMIRIMP